MRVSYSVTFEFDLRAPLTHRGVVEAGSPHVCMGKATKAAWRALRPRGWSSVVCVLLERLDQGGKDEEEEDAADAEEESEEVKERDTPEAL